LLAKCLGECTTPAAQYTTGYDGRRFDDLHITRSHAYRLVCPSVGDYSETARHFRVYALITDNLGLEEAPSADTLRRSWNAFTPAYRRALEEFAATIRDHVIDLDTPISTADLRRAQDLEATDADDEQSRISDTRRERVRKEAQNHLYETLTFDRADNASVPEHDLLDAVSYLSAHEEFPEDGTKQFCRRTDSQPFSPETLRLHMREQPLNVIHEQLDDGIERLVEAAKAEGCFDRPCTLSIDFTERPYWRQSASEAAEGVIKTHKMNSRYAYRWLTVSATDRGKTITLASLPIRRKKQTNSLAIAVIRRAAELVPVEHVLADAEFANREIFKYLHHEGIDYIFRNRMTSSVKRTIRENQDQEAIVDSYEVEDSNHQRTEATLLCVTKTPRSERVETSGDGDQATLTSFTDDGEAEANVDDWVSFLTSYDIEESDAREYADQYRRRWAIESQYRVQKDSFFARTASRSFELRQYLWMFATLFYNLWVLLALLLQEIGVEPRPDGRVGPTVGAFAHHVWETDYG